MHERTPVRAGPWWEQTQVLEALLIWHGRWWMRSAERLERGTGRPSLRLLIVAEHDACLAFGGALRAARAPAGAKS